jgi:hypothetical protein
MHHHWSKPAQVLRNPALSKEEKRALLASWASDVHAIADAPSLRRLEDGTVLHIDDILEALKALDAGAETIRRPAARLPVRRPDGKPYFRLVDDDDDPPPKPAAAPIPKGWTFELMTYEARAA